MNTKDVVYTKSQVTDWFGKLDVVQKATFTKEFTNGEPSKANIENYFDSQEKKVLNAVHKYAGKKGFPKFPVSTPVKKPAAVKTDPQVKKPEPKKADADPKKAAVIPPVVKNDSVKEPVKDEPKKNSWLPWLVGVIVVIALLVLFAFASGGFVKTQIGSTAPAQQQAAQTPVANAAATVPTFKATEQAVAVPGMVLPVNDPMVIGRDDPYKEVLIAEKVGTFQPIWPEGTIQTSVGYSNPEEFPDGRTFMTRSQSNPNEILAFVARCISINNGPKFCHSDKDGAVVGLIIGHPDGEYPVKLWDAELKTLTIPGGLISWKAYINELADFISANKGGKAVEILGSK
jgi:hypothetical protein